jgi:hypothetical protein
MNEPQSNPSLFEHIPAEVKGQLLEIAERLPNKEAQRSFLIGVSDRIGGLVKTYENTIVYSARERFFALMDRLASINP